MGILNYIKLHALLVRPDSGPISANNGVWVEILNCTIPHALFACPCYGPLFACRCYQHVLCIFSADVGVWVEILNCTIPHALFACPCYGPLFACRCYPPRATNIFIRCRSMGRDFKVHQSPRTFCLSVLPTRFWQNFPFYENFSQSILTFLGNYLILYSEKREVSILHFPILSTF